MVDSRSLRSILPRDSVDGVTWVAIAVALLAGMAVGAGAQEFPVPEVRLPLLARAPQIDGRVEETEWAAAARMEGLGRGPKLAPLEAAFWLGCDGKELFIAVVSETPPGGRLLARFVPLPQDADARTWLDDSIELVFDPLRHDAARRRLYHANINAKGAINDTAYRLDGGGEAWRGKWRIANQIIGDRWHFEAALPLADMGVSAADLARPWGVRLGRNWQQTRLAQQTEWSPRGGPYLTPETMPLVAWDPAAPVVQVVQLAEPDTGKPHLRLTLFNPGSQPIAVKTLLRLTPQSSLPQEVRRSLTLAPGQTLPVALPGSALNEDLTTLIHVTSADERTTFHRRDFVWRAERQGSKWDADVAAARRVQTQFAYYPSFHRVHFQLDVSGLENRDQVTGAKLEIRRQGTTAAIAATELPALQQYRSRRLWDVPPLGEGTYEAVLTLAGPPLRADRAPVRAARVPVGRQPARQVGRAGRAVHGDPGGRPRAEHDPAAAHAERAGPVGPGGLRLLRRPRVRGGAGRPAPAARRSDAAGHYRRRQDGSGPRRVADRRPQRHAGGHRVHLVRRTAPRYGTRPMGLRRPAEVDAPDRAGRGTRGGGDAGDPAAGAADAVVACVYRRAAVQLRGGPTRPGCWARGSRPAPVRAGLPTPPWQPSFVTRSVTATLQTFVTRSVTAA